MKKKDLVVGEKYLLILEDLTEPLSVYYTGQSEDFNVECDHCGKDLKNPFLFSQEYYKDDIEKTWDSGSWMVGTTCLKKCIFKYID